MLPIYHLYLNKETKEMEIHEENCKVKDQRVKEGKIIHRNHLGPANSIEEVYNKYKHVFPMKIINLPDCCDK